MATYTYESIFALNTMVQEPNPFLVAHIARRKMALQAARCDHDLRVLVGHANTIDHLEVVISKSQKQRLDELSKYSSTFLKSKSTSSFSVMSTDSKGSTQIIPQQNQYIEAKSSCKSSSPVQVLPSVGEVDEDSESSSSDNDEEFDLGLQRTTSYVLGQSLITAGLKVMQPSAQQVTITEVEVCD